MLDMQWVRNQMNKASSKRPTPVAERGGKPVKIGNGNKPIQFVYATEQRYRTFRIADRREAIPAGARIYATCTRESTLENLGQFTFDNMSDDELYELKDMIREARERAQTETEARPDTSCTSNFITRFFNS